MTSLPNNEENRHKLPKHNAGNANRKNIDSLLVEFIEALGMIKENKASAKINEFSMLDNIGRRIYY